MREASVRTSLRLSAFVLGLVVVFAAATGLGRWVGPEPEPPPATAAEHGAEPHGEQAGHADAVPAGLQTTQDGYRLQALTPALTTGAPQPFRFRILGPDGRPVTRYATEHEKDLHLIVVRRDLAGFRHVHPVLGTDGTWEIPLAVAAPGQYRVFADFRPAALDDGLTLGVDVPAPGDYRPVPLPAPAPTGTVDGYTVTLTGTLTPGTASTVTAAVSRNGKPVTDLQPYLGASGHLVALRQGDLAYLHVHPQSGTTFVAEVPSDGAYRLYFDFKHGDVVRTAEFTREAGR
ncbi:hypothetical protein [Cryptosporangium arvum]|uniref:hypothetical protein n=1 Tax=Cryptosporangium arvum TaxID=80871 RepID=UPI000687D64A|nr:hypothetical protein [Cryptosporangium arvum]